MTCEDDDEVAKIKALEGKYVRLYFLNLYKERMFCLWGSIFLSFAVLFSLFLCSVIFYVQARSFAISC